MQHTHSSTVTTHTQQYCDSTHTAHSQTDSHGATRDGSILQPTAVESKSKTQNGRSCGGFSVLCILMILSKKVFKHLMSFMCLAYQASPHTKFWLSDVAQLLFHLQSVLPRSRVLTQTWHLSRVRRKHSVARSLAPCFLRTKPETGIWWEIDIFGGSLRDSFRIDLSFLC